MLGSAPAPVAVREHAPIAARSRLRGGYFLIMSVLLFAIVLTGFGQTLYLRAFFNVPQIPVYLYVHGTVLTAWYALFVIQMYYVAIRRTDLHRRLGVIGVYISAACLWPSLPRWPQQ